MKKLHFTGIAGAGMAPLAQLSLARGFSVSGSDEIYSPKCRKLEESGAVIYTGHASENLPKDADLLIYSSAVPEDNCERVKARSLGIREIRRGEFLAQISADYSRCVSVTGTHGKSSITASLCSILLSCGMDPGFLIGAEVIGMPGCAGGSGDIFVTEADESDGTHAMMKNFLAVIPNIEDDHEWSLGGRDVLEQNFRTVAANSQHIIYYASEKCDELLGSHPSAVRLDEVPEKFGSLYGFQAANAFIAAHAAVILGCDMSKAFAAAADYPQVARRMTVHKQQNGVTVIEDYAHHPTEVRAAMELLRYQYPDHHLRIIFQPHRFARLEKYFTEFADVLQAADSCFIAPVFAAWSECGAVDSAMLAAAVKGKLLSGSVHEWAAAATENLPEKCVIAVLGAGDVNEVIKLL